MTNSIDPTQVASDFFRYFTTQGLTADTKSFTAAEDKGAPRTILKELCAKLNDQKLILPFLNTMFTLLGDDSTGIRDQVSKLQDKNYMHDDMARMLNDYDDLTVSDFTTGFNPIDTHTGQSSFIFSHGDNRSSPFTVTMYHNVNPVDKTISKINIQVNSGRGQEIPDLSGDVADESNLQKALSNLWHREYEKQD